MAPPRKHLPAAPLAALIDRMCAKDGDAKAVLARLGVDQRKVYDWRHRPNANVDSDRADRVLSASPYLWFDVWPECEEHAARRIRSARRAGTTSSRAGRSRGSALPARFERRSK
jgi:hypothetical protein